MGTLRSWVFVSIFVFYLCHETSSQPPDSSSTSAPRAVSGLDEFVRKGTGVVQMANGVIIQGQLLENADNVYSVAADLLHVNSTGFSQMMHLKLDGVLESVTRLNLDSLNNKTSFKKQDIAEGVKLLNSVVKSMNTLGARGSTAVKEFADAINHLKSNPPQLFDVAGKYDILGVLRCRNQHVYDANLKHCHKLMKDSAPWRKAMEDNSASDYKTSMASSLRLMAATDALEEVLPGIHQLSQTVDSLKNLQTLPKSMDGVEKELEKYADIRNTLNESSGEELRRLLRVALKRETGVPFEFTQGLSGGTGDLAELFRNMEKGGMLETVIADGLAERLDLLKTVLIPLEKFSGQMTEVEGAFGGWKNVSSLNPNKVLGMQSLQKLMDDWKTLTQSQFNSVKTCFSNLLSLKKPLNIDHFFPFSTQISELKKQLHKYFDEIEALSVLVKNKQMFEEFSKLMSKFSASYVLNELRRDFVTLNANLAANNQLNTFVQQVHTGLDNLKSINARFPKLADVSSEEFLKPMLVNLQSSEFAKTSECASKNSDALNITALGSAAVEEFENGTNSSLVDMKSGLENLLKMKKIMEEVHANWTTLGKETRRRRRDDSIDEYRKALLLDKQSFPGLLTGLEIVKRMRDAHGNVGILMKSLKIQGTFKNEFAEEWRSSGERMTETTINELHALEVAVSSGTVDLAKIKKVYGEASKMRGVRVNWNRLDDFLAILNKTNNKNHTRVANALAQMRDMTLDFDIGHDAWNLIFLSVGAVRSFLNEIFQIVDDDSEDGPAAKSSIVWLTANADSPVFFLISIVSGIFLIVLLVAAIIYSFTPNGRSRLKRFRVSRYGSLEEIELYWRYSFFLDQESDTNTLLEAAREVNYEQVKASVSEGAYVNVYNCFGSTPLHVAVEYGHLPTVKYLLRHGADRKALNADNKTAEKTLTDYLKNCNTTENTKKPNTSESTTTTTTTTSRRQAGNDKMGSYKEIAELFEKYRNKTFRPVLPQLLPTMAYHIRIDDRVTHKSADKFVEMFRGNVTDQKSGVTHFIVPTGKGGVFKSDDFGYIMCVFLPTILMEERWMSECLENKSNFRDDYKFRVKKVKYKGVVYETVLKWAGWVHKQMLPYLYGVRLHVAIADFAEGDAVQLRLLVEMHGAVWCDEMPVKEQFNVGSHPFHHQNMGPLFVIHDGKTNLDHLRNDSDRMFTLMTLEEFIIFMLQMKVTHAKQNKELVSVAISRDLTEASSVAM